jgi:hypothetical protein
VNNICKGYWEKRVGELCVNPNHLNKLEIARWVKKTWLRIPEEIIRESF